jgi:hypothetical protein
MYRTLIGADIAVAVSIGPPGGPWVETVLENVAGDDFNCGGIAVDSNNNLFAIWENWTHGGARWATKPYGGAWTAAANLPTAHENDYWTP